jgi:Fe-S-cluster containining protein
MALKIELSLFGTPFTRELDMPSGPVRPVRVLPVFQAITDEIVARSVEQVTREGKAVSCAAGCGACCRQLVPIGQIEARHLARVVEASPEPRRRVVRERFADAKRRLTDAGLWQRLLAREQCTEEEAEALALDYFRAGVACPFLEQESCSIHPDRPLSCREFLVTSPAAHCADPKPETIEPVPLPSHPSDALARVGSKRRDVHWMPLVLAFEETASQKQEPPRRTPLELVNEFLGLLVALED